MAAALFTCPRCGTVIMAEDGYGMAVNADGASRMVELRETCGPGVCLTCAAPVELTPGMPPRWLTIEEFRSLPYHIQGFIAQAIVAIVTKRPSEIRATDAPSGTVPPEPLHS